MWAMIEKLRMCCMKPRCRPRQSRAGPENGEVYPLDADPRTAARAGRACPRPLPPRRLRGAGSLGPRREAALEGGLVQHVLADDQAVDRHHRHAAAELVAPARL